MVKNKEMITEICYKLFKLLDSKLAYSFNRENARDLCDYCSNSNFYCLAGRSLLMPTELGFSFEPFVQEMIVLTSDRKCFTLLSYDEGDQTLFQVEFSDSPSTSDPIVWKCVEGDWVFHLDRMIAFISDYL